MLQIEDKQMNCNMPSHVHENKFAEEEFVPGSLVWAKLGGYPWWPGIVEDCPDEGHYFRSSEEGNEYHVIFFADKPLRSWLPTTRVMDFNKSPPPPDPSKKKKASIKSLERAILEAQKAAKIPLQKRLDTYSFAVRYEGKWGKTSKACVELPKPPKNSVIKTKKIQGKEDAAAAKQTKRAETNEQHKRGRKKSKVDIDSDSKVSKVNASENTTLNSSEACAEVGMSITDNSKSREMSGNNTTISNKVEMMKMTIDEKGSERQTSENDKKRKKVVYTDFQLEYLRALKFYFEQDSGSD